MNNFTFIPNENIPLVTHYSKDHEDDHGDHDNFMITIHQVMVE